MKILVADDDPDWRMLIAEDLSRWSHDIVEADDGAAAWDMIQADPEITLVITDWMMPRLDGPELCRKARKLERSRYLFVIMLTSHSQKEQLLYAMEAGADAFVTKPFDSPELLAHIRVAERILHLEERIAQNLDELRKANHLIRLDLEAAAKVQRALLPHDPPHVPGVEFAWVFDSCREVGGDMFNCFPLGPDHIAMHILDVSGHGVQAAMLSVSVNRLLNPLPDGLGLLRRAPGVSGNGIVPPSEVAAELNRRFPMPEETNQYFTFLYGVLNTKTRELRTVRAGHPCPIVVTRNGACEVDRTQGLPIGFMPEAEFKEGRMVLEPGDKVIFYTDGVIEAFDNDLEQFGIEKTLEILSDTRSLSIKESLDAVSEGVRAFVGSAEQSDDITLVGLQVS